MVKHIRLVTVLGTCVMALVAVHAQKGATTGPLTARDYIEIQQLAYKYAYALDTGAGQGQMYANLFGPDATFGKAKGHDALVKLAWQHMPEQGPALVKHFIVNHAIEQTPQGVVGKQYIIDMMFGEGGKPDSFTSVGVYHDDYVRTPDGWRFGNRRFVASKTGTEAAATVPPLRLDMQPLVSAAAGSAKAGRAPLTAEDYLEIEQLVTRYPYALDTGAGSGTMYSNLFTPDGVFGRSIGREAIAKMAYQHMPEQGPRYTKHFITNHMIQSTPEGIVGSEYAIVLAPGEGGKPTTITAAGLYQDVYEKTNEGWRFKSRKFAGLKAVFQPAAEQSREESTPAMAAKSSNSKTGSLTPLDYVQIRQLVTRSAYAMDSGAGQSYADLFVADGLSSSDGRKYQGAKELAELAKSHGGKPGALHYITDQWIEPAAGGGATGKSYLAHIQTADGKPSTVSGGGRFDDVYVNTPEGWRLKSRTLTPSKEGVDAPQASR